MSPRHRPQPLRRQPLSRLGVTSEPSMRSGKAPLTPVGGGVVGMTSRRWRSAGWSHPPKPGGRRCSSLLDVGRQAPHDAPGGRGCLASPTWWWSATGRRVGTTEAGGMRLWFRPPRLRDLEARRVEDELRSMPSLLWSGLLRQSGRIFLASPYGPSHRECWPQPFKYHVDSVRQSRRWCRQCGAHRGI